MSLRRAPIGIQIHFQVVRLAARCFSSTRSDRARIIHNILIMDALSPQNPSRHAQSRAAILRLEGLGELATTEAAQAVHEGFRALHSNNHPRENLAVRATEFVGLAAERILPHVHELSPVLAARVFSSMTSPLLDRVERV